MPKVPLFLTLAVVTLANVALAQSPPIVQTPAQKKTQKALDKLPAQVVKDSVRKNRTKADPKDDPDKYATITTVKKGEDTVQEFRIKGQFYKMKVTPAVGPSYYLIDPKGNGDFTRQDGPSEKFSVPTWVIFEF